MSDQVRTIRLEVRLDGDSPAGSATACGERSREFAGWLGLVAAIEALLTGDRPPGAETTTVLHQAEAATDDGSTPQH